MYFGRPLFILAALALMPACTTPDDVTDEVEPTQPIFGPQAPPCTKVAQERVWDGIPRNVPGGGGTLVIYRTEANPSVIQAALLDMNNRLYCDVFQAPIAKTGDIINAIMANDQELTLVGAFGRVPPPPPPPPGTDLIQLAGNEAVLMAAERNQAEQATLAGQLLFNGQ